MMQEPQGLIRISGYLQTCAKELSKQGEKGWPDLLVLPRPKDDDEWQAMSLFAKELRRLGMHDMRLVFVGKKDHTADVKTLPLPPSKKTLDYIESCAEALQTQSDAAGGWPSPLILPTPRTADDQDGLDFFLRKLRSEKGSQVYYLHAVGSLCHGH